jgi:hypothetical protein
MAIRDATKQDKTSIITIKSMEAKELKDSDFQQSSLGP